MLNDVTVLCSALKAISLYTRPPYQYYKDIVTKIVHKMNMQLEIVATQRSHADAEVRTLAVKLWSDLLQTAHEIREDGNPIVIGLLLCKAALATQPKRRMMN